MFRSKLVSKFGISKVQKKAFSDVLSLPTIDVNKYLNKSTGWEKEAKLVADCLHDTGVLVIKDPVRNLF